MVRVINSGMLLLPYNTVKSFPDALLQKIVSFISNLLAEFGECDPQNR